jgi:hypothetical protein
METLLNQLIDLLNSYRILHHEHRNEKLFSRYLTRKNHKKALFYLNPQKKKIIFGIGHHGTKILEELPTIKLLADETKIAVIKFSITKPEDIENKAIRFLIEQCIDITGKSFFKMESFSLKALEKTKKR